MYLKFNLTATAAVLGLLVSSCIDDKYDLSDIDTNVRVEINDLTIPVNIDEITLKSVFDIEEGDRVQEIDGQYAIVEDGEFTSEDIKIDEVRFPAPYVPTTTASISTGFSGSLTLPSGINSLELPFSTEPSSFSVYTDEINSYIVSVDRVGCRFSIKLSISIKELGGLINAFEVKELKVKLPKGLSFSEISGTYDPVTGILDAGTVRGVNNTITLGMVVDGIDFSKAAINYVVDGNGRSMTFADDVYIESAKLMINRSDFNSTPVIPSNLSLLTSCEVGEIALTSLTGEIDYSLSGVDFTDVALDNLPDILSQKETNIVLANPQIYLAVNNPLDKYNLHATTGLTIKAEREGSAPDSYSLDAPGIFTIPGVRGTTEYSFCLSPEKPKNYYAGFENSTHVGYKSLSHVLSGNGLPASLAILLDDPKLPQQKVTDFTLGQTLGRVKGRYCFFAPVQLGEGSRIVYSDEIDGWSDDELENVTVNTLKIKAVITTDMPVSLDVSAYPIDVNGNRINNVSIEGMKIAATSSPQEVTISITGSVRGVDGIRYTATAHADDNSGVLSPNMTIKLSDVRATVGGYYEKEL